MKMLYSYGSERDHHLKARLIRITVSGQCRWRLTCSDAERHQHGSPAHAKDSRAQLAHRAEVPVSRTGYDLKGSG